jgi:hypothetical protein
MERRNQSSISVLSPAIKNTFYPFFLPVHDSGAFAGVLFFSALSL